MTEPRRPLTDAELEAALRDLGAHLAYPPTPPLAQTVRTRLTSPPRRPTWALGPVRRLALAALALVLLTGAVLALSPAARTVVADRLGLDGVTIIHLPGVPTPTPTPTPAPTPMPTFTPVPVGVRLGLGQPVALAEARARVGYPVLAPALPELGEPDAVYLSEPPAGGQVALVYRDRPGLPVAPETGVAVLLTQFQGRLEPQFMGKGLGPDTRLEQVTVEGWPAFWIEGQAHVFFYRDRAGQVRDERLRLAGNVLLWQQGDLTLRLEGAFSRETALRIAASLR